MEYEADVCPEWLKNVKEQANLIEFRFRLVIPSQILGNHYQLSEIN